MNLDAHIRDIRDFPKPGIVFKDITPLLGNAEAWGASVSALSKPYTGQSIDAIVGIESRGFIFGAAVAYELNIGFIPIRKPEKLPADTLSVSYALEYGEDTVEIHRDALTAGQSVVIMDDVLATGGTMAAACELVEKTGADIVGLAFLVELGFLEGRARLGDHPIHSVLTY
jgi:adenine phosphoribosyltransferase